MREIASERYRDLTSPSLLGLRDRLVSSKQELARLMRRRRELEIASRKLDKRREQADTWWGRLRRLNPAEIELRQREVMFELAEGEERVEELHRASRIEYDDASRAWVAHVGPAFDRLARCHRVWDVTHGGGETHYKSWAGQTIERRPVRLRRDRLPQLHPEAETFCFGNANGPDLHLLPSMLALVRRQGDVVGEIALVRFSDCTVEVDLTRFQETEAVPPDATVAGHSWRYVNNDGGPDRRFADNPRIPVCAYGRVSIRSTTGLHEEYMLSDAEATVAFAETLQGAHEAANRHGEA